MSLLLLLLMKMLLLLRRWLLNNSLVLKLVLLLLLMILWLMRYSLWLSLDFDLGCQVDHLDFGTYVEHFHFWRYHLNLGRDTDHQVFLMHFPLMSLHFLRTIEILSAVFTLGLDSVVNGFDMLTHVLNDGEFLRAYFAF